ncbi:MAG: substrate-binding domain-containing protein, partial [Cytophagales bacterium]|nr:substrate-binding domain-containing protein [Cytophagales bacterium]
MKMWIKLVICTLFSAVLYSGSSQAATLKVAVAANFKPVMKELVARFQQDTGHKITLSFASTGALYNQLLHGA